MLRYPAVSSSAASAVEVPVLQALNEGVGRVYSLLFAASLYEACDAADATAA